MDDDLTFGRWLKARRRGLDLTQEALAGAIGCSVDMVRKLEAGRRRPSRQVADLLAACLAVPAGERADFVRWARAAEAAPRPRTAAPPIAAAPALPPGAAPAGPPALPGAALPVPPTPLVGRTGDVAAVRALLWRATTRLVTLTGPPGIGKTRLALAAAAALADDRDDGVCYVVLAPGGDPALVATTIAQRLGVAVPPHRPALDVLMAHLRDSTLLLVLDNLEQVPGAAAVVTGLLAGTQRLKVLVTSRTPLHLRGEKEFPLAPLALPPGDTLPPLDALAQVDSVALFLERAQDAQHDFVLDAANAATVAAICRRLEGLPLAIELAATKIKLLSPSDLLAGLEHRLGLLTGGPRDMLPQQQSLYGAIQASYDLLPAPTQRIFRRLGVFVAPFTLAAARAVAGAALDDLAALLDASLVTRDHAAEGAAATGETRFVMLATLAEFAVAALRATGELDAARAAHAASFLRLAEEARPALAGGPEQAIALARLTAAQDDLRAALAWALEVPGGGDVAVRLAGALWRFWYVQGSYAEGRRWLDRALAIGDAVAPGPRALALHGAGTLAYSLGTLDDATRRLEAGLALRRALGNRADIASTLNNLGIVAQARGDYAGAMAIYREVVALRRAEGDPVPLAAALNNAGMGAALLGEHAQARALLTEALALHRALDDPRGAAIALNNLAETSSGAGDYAAAQTYAGESLALCRELGDRPGTAHALGILGEAAARQGDYAVAAPLLAESVATFQAIGNPFFIAEGLEWLARIAAATGQPARAARLAGAAAALREASGVPMNPTHVAAYAADLDAARAAIGAAAWQAATAVGRSLTPAAMARLAQEPGA